MRVFLVHVRDPQFYAIPSKRRARNGRLQVMGFPPIGIMSLSSVLKRAGHECVMFDQANPETPDERIVEEMARQKPDLVGLSFLSTTSYPYAKILARRIRTADADVKIAMGGVFVSLNAQLVKMQCPEVDFVCRGTGSSSSSTSWSASTIPAPWTASPGRSRTGGYATTRTARSRATWTNGPSRTARAWSWTSWSRCPWTCRRCCPWSASPPCRPRGAVRGPASSATSPSSTKGSGARGAREHVVAEFEQLRKDGYGSVYFVDDHFLLQPRRIEAICKGIIENDIPIQWGCEGRVDSTCMQLFPIMAKAHCRTLMFGIESGSQKILDRLQKEQTLQEVETAVDNAKAAGIEIVHGFFVVGSPDETEADMRETFRFASRLKIDSSASTGSASIAGHPCGRSTSGAAW